MSRIISGKVRLDPQHVDLLKCRPRNRSKRCGPRRRRNGVRPGGGSGTDRRKTISGDPHRLQQVFWNLLTNAVKSHPAHKGGDVRIRLHPHQLSRRSWKSSDTGEGIDPAFLPFLFLTDSSKPTHRRPAGTAAWAWASRSSGNWWNCTGETFPPPVKGAAMERNYYGPTTPLGTGQNPTRESNVTTKACCLNRESHSSSHSSRRLRAFTCWWWTTNRMRANSSSDLLHHAGATVSMAASAAEALERIASRPSGRAGSLRSSACPKEDGYSLIQKIALIDEGRGERSRPLP